jgi:uncharacterized protein YjbI with pentapeptide repeats
MANPEQLEVLRQGVEAWNKWRLEHRSIFQPDLSKADLSSANLSEANLHLADLSEANLSKADLTRATLSVAKLSGADLSSANLSEANLLGADLSEANLSEANLSKANLLGADLSRAELSGADLSHADLSLANLSRAELSGANLSRAKLSEARFRDANLSHANLSHADLGGARLRDANLSDANLSDANLSGTNLSGANLSDAHLSDAHLGYAILIGANLSRAELSGADLTEAVLSQSLLTATDLSQAKGLESVIHHGPSSLGIDTFFRSKGKIPEVFLRGAGVADTFIQYASSLVGVPFDFYSCFISYCTKDEEFATRLHNDFQAKGIRCWKWDDFPLYVLYGGPEEMLRDNRVDEKLVLIASESSLKSPAVLGELERALVQEDERQKRKLAGDSSVDSDVLFPVCLDDFIFKGWEHERKVDVTKKVIADARGWANDPAVYPRVLEQLLHDLKSEESKPDPSAK